MGVAFSKTHMKGTRSRTERTTRPACGTEEVVLNRTDCLEQNPNSSLPSRQQAAGSKRGHPTEWAQRTTTPPLPEKHPKQAKLECESPLPSGRKTSLSDISKLLSAYDRFGAPKTPTPIIHPANLPPKSDRIKNVKTFEEQDSNVSGISNLLSKYDSPRTSSASSTPRQLNVVSTLQTLKALSSACTTKTPNASNSAVSATAIARDDRSCGDMLKPSRSLPLENFDGDLPADGQDNNGWRWLGASWNGPVFISAIRACVKRRCFYSICHPKCGEVKVHSCVQLQQKDDEKYPHIAKIINLWERPEDSTMMMTVQCYYYPEQTLLGRRVNDSKDEVFISYHRDNVAVGDILDKCTVLPFQEYCQQRMETIGMGQEDNAIPTNVAGETPPNTVLFYKKYYDPQRGRLGKYYA